MQIAVRGAVMFRNKFLNGLVFLEGDTPSLKMTGIVDVCYPAEAINW
jgi:hypothetical protein